MLYYSCDVIINEVFNYFQLSSSTDDKKSIKRKEENIKKKEHHGSERRKKDPEISTQDRSRVSDGRTKKEPTKNVEKKDMKSNINIIREKDNSILVKKFESKINTKTSSSLTKTKRPPELKEKPQVTREVKRSHPDAASKSKEYSSSPYVAGSYHCYIIWTNIIIVIF